MLISLTLGLRLSELSDYAAGASTRYLGPLGRFHHVSSYAVTSFLWASLRRKRQDETEELLTGLPRKRVVNRGDQCYKIFILLLLVFCSSAALRFLSLLPYSPLRSLYSGAVFTFSPIHSKLFFHPNFLLFIFYLFKNKTQLKHQSKPKPVNMKFSVLTATLLFSLAIASPLPKKAKASSTAAAAAASSTGKAAAGGSVLTASTYNAIQISAGTAGTGETQANALFASIDKTNLAGVSAADLKVIKGTHDAAEDAEVKAFNPAIAAASGAAATALQVCKSE